MRQLQNRKLLTGRRRIVHQLSGREFWLCHGPCKCRLLRCMCGRAILGTRLLWLHDLQCWFVFRSECSVVLELCRRSVRSCRFQRMRQLCCRDILVGRCCIVHNLSRWKLRLNHRARKCRLLWRVCTWKVLSQWSILVHKMRCGSVRCVGLVVASSMLRCLFEWSVCSNGCK